MDYKKPETADDDFMEINRQDKNAPWNTHTSLTCSADSQLPFNHYGYDIELLSGVEHQQYFNYLDNNDIKQQSILPSSNFPSSIEECFQIDPAVQLNVSESDQDFVNDKDLHFALDTNANSMSTNESSYQSSEYDLNSDISPNVKINDLTWVTPETGDSNLLKDASSKIVNDEKIDLVRKRIEKRKNRKAIKPAIQKEVDAKGNKNTLAARRYRKKRQEEVEILDTKVKELDQKLQSAILEAQWWKMEAERWKKLAQEKN